MKKTNQVHVSYSEPIPLIVELPNFSTPFHSVNESLEEVWQFEKAEKRVCVKKFVIS